MAIIQRHFNNINSGLSSTAHTINPYVTMLLI